MEHLSMIESIVGPFPAWMCKHATGNGLQYVDGSRLRKPESVLSEASRRSVAQCRPVQELIHSRHQPFAKLLRHMLSICPRIRPSARSLYKTEFFSMPLPPFSRSYVQMGWINPPATPGRAPRSAAWSS